MNAAEPAPAKINLTLHVTGQREDGYHLLDSLVVFTQLGDVLHARNASGGLSLQVIGPEAAGLSGEGDNLVLRAARLAQADGLALTLDKHLPVASGIGGGSTDAAATLRLISRLTGKPLPDDALTLGADVPVCLARIPCRMQGIGEQVSVVQHVPSLAMVLVNPRVAVPTPSVFVALASKSNPPMPDMLPLWRDFDGLTQWLAVQRNDLQPPACQHVPQIQQVLRALDATGAALSRMSGSGATCFGLFPDMASADAAATRLAQAQPGWWVRATAVLT